MESTIPFDLVSPEQLIFNDKVGMVIIPGKDGDIGVLPNHSRLLSSLRPGRVMIYDENKKLINSFFVSAGFVEINPEGCLLLAEQVFEINSLDVKEIEMELSEIANETSEESKEKYLIAKHKLEAINSKFYLKI